MKIGPWPEIWLIRQEWEIYRRFLMSLDDHISGDIHDLENILLNWEQTIEQEHDEVQQETFREFHEDEYYDFQQLKAILLNSFFTASYALFEHHLRQLFRIPASENFYASRANTRLTELGIADTPEWNKMWNKINKKYRTIRNKIVHEGGVVRKGWENFDYAKARGIIEPSEVPPDSLELPRYIKVTREFCDEACNDFMNFLIQVYEAIHSDANPAKPADSSGQDPVHVEKASIWGYLRAVDWTNKTARLERIVGKPVPLKFGDDLAEDMRRFATEYAQIRGEGVIGPDDEWVSVKVASITGTRNKFEPFDMEEFLARPRKPSDFKALPQLPPDDDFDVDDFNRIIREGRNVGLGRKE